MKLHPVFSKFEKKGIYVSNLSAQLDGKFIKGINFYFFFYIFASSQLEKCFSISAKNAFIYTKHTHHLERALFGLKKNSLSQIKILKISHRFLKISLQIHLNLFVDYQLLAWRSTIAWEKSNKWKIKLLETTAH